MFDSEAFPYCGSAPVPGTATWNLDPILIVVLGLIAIGYVLITRTDGLGAWQRASFLTGWFVLFLALVSPLCNLSVALFSARVGQHMVLTFIAAPLMAAGMPTYFARLGRRFLASGTQLGGHGLLAGVFYATALWVWHWPGPYDLTFQNTLIYWTMHITLIATAVVLWVVVMDHRRPVAGLIATAFTTLQMTFLGVILTFAKWPFFSVHVDTTAAWNFTPLEDQQLGGLIMWIPTGVLLLSFALWTLASMLSSDNESEKKLGV